MAGAARSAGDDPAARLLEIGVAYVVFAVEHADYYAAFNSQEMRAAQSSPDALDSGTESHCEPGAEREPGDTWVGLLNAVLACQASGDLPPGDPVVLGVYLWSLVHGFVELWRTGPLSLLPQAHKGPEALARQVLSAAIDSMSTKGRD